VPNVDPGLQSDNPQAYLPGDRRRALADGRELPDRVRGAALFADISGFTPLTEALVAELGAQRGAEELTATLDAIIGPLLVEIDRRGGDVVYFSGDAVTAWIDDDDGLQAVACALAMQQLMAHLGIRTTPGGTTIRVGLKVAVAVGAARRFVVGDHRVQLIDVLAGALMDSLAEAERVAQQGEVVLDAAGVASLGDRALLGRHDEASGAATVDSLAVVPGLPDARAALPTLPDSEVRKWLLPRVFERMVAGHGEFLAELRPAVPLFLRFGGIDYDNDPAATAKLDDLVQQAQRVVDAHGGNIMQLTIGDKGAYLYAVFGTPIAHENDAARACASALELARIDQSTAATGVQIGIASGRLRSGTYGHSDRRTFCCLGDAVNLAARLMSAAPPGSIYVSAEVRRAANVQFEWGESANLRVAGKSADVLASPLLAPRRRSRQPQRTEVDDLIGRAAELSQLQDIAARALDGQGRLVVIDGAGGVGKSRLLIEMNRWLDERGVRARRAAAASYGARTSYGVWADIYRDAWDIDADAAPAQIMSRLDSVLAAVDPNLRSRLPLLGAVLGVALPDTSLTMSFDAKLRKTSLESMLVDLLEASAAAVPLAFVIDAAEHLDELSWDLLEAYGRALSRLPVLVLVARRPTAGESEQPLSALPQVHRMTLGGLDAETSRELVVNRLRSFSNAPMPRQALDRLTRLADGNPFHLEELVNYLIDRGIEPGRAAEADIDLPTSLHSLELARIDVLPESPRRTIKVASVVGARFERPVVAGSYPELGTDSEIGDQLQVLATASLVIADSEDARSYTFRNITTQQVAYETLPFASRSTLHDRIREWLETHAPAGPDSILELLAHHAWFGTDDRKKIDYLVRAGQAAQARYANDAAIDYFGRALLLAPADVGAQLQQWLGKVLELTGRWPEAEQAQLQAAALYSEQGNREGWANVQADLAEIARKQGRFEQARQLLLAADEVFRTERDRAGRGNVLHLLGTLAAQQGDHEQARESYRASLAIRTELGDRLKIGALLSNLAIVAEQLGEYDDARQLNEQALAVREEVGDPWAMAVSHNNLGMIALLQQDYPRAAVHIDASMGLAAQVGDRWLVAVGQHNNGIARRGLAHYDESGDSFLAALQTYLDHDDRWSLALLLEDVAFLAVDTGQHANALRVVAAADALRSEIDAPRAPAPAELLDRTLAASRDRVGPDLMAEIAISASGAFMDIAILVHQTCTVAPSVGHENDRQK
jgi:adenylate cyclase